MRCSKSRRDQRSKEHDREPDFLNDTYNQDLASWNLYVRNNPLVYVDPSGKEFRIAQRREKDAKVVDTISGEDRKEDWFQAVALCA